MGLIRMQNPNLKPLTAYDVIDTFPDDARVDLALGSGQAITITKDDLRVLMGRWDLDSTEVEIDVPGAGNRVVATGCNDYQDWLFAIYSDDPEIINHFRMVEIERADVLE